MTSIPEHDPGEYAEGFVDPASNPDVPFVCEYDVTDPDPCPPADRLAEEPEEVEV